MTEPRSIGDYQLSGVLGEGGQGVVHLGLGPSGERVAVKVSRTRIARDPSVRRSFLKEVEAARSVAPFCTTRVLDSGIHDDRPYLVSEYVDGVSLWELVAVDGPRDVAGLRRLATATLTALRAIHDAGVVHRDLKPGNVIMGPEGPVVVDFGIAKALGGDTTRSGLVGTPGYLAPELFEDAAASPASDVFAWGVTMIYAATGRAPFQAGDLTATMNAVMYREADLSGVPAELLPLLRRALAKDPADRPTAADLLAAVTGGPEGAAVRARWARPAGDGAAVRRRGWRWIGWGTALVAATAAAMYGIHVVRVMEQEYYRPAAPTPPPLARHLADFPDAAGALKVVVGRSGDRPVAVTGAYTGAVRVFDLATGGLISGSEERRSPVVALAAGKGVAVAADEAGRLWVVDLANGKRRPRPLADHAGRVESVAVATVEGRTVALYLTGSGLHRVDVATGEAVGRVTPSVTAITMGTLRGRQVLVQADLFHQVTVIDLETGRRVRKFRDDQTNRVSAVALGELDGVPIVVTASERDPLWKVWDLDSGTMRWQSSLGPEVSPRDLRIGAAPGTTLLACEGDSGWTFVDLRTGRRLDWFPDVYDVALAGMKGRLIAVTTFHEVKSWSLEPRPGVA